MLKIKNVSSNTLEIIKISLLTTTTISACGLYYKYFFVNRKLEMKIQSLEYKNKFLQKRIDDYEKLPNLLEIKKS